MRSGRGPARGAAAALAASVGAGAAAGSTPEAGAGLDRVERAIVRHVEAREAQALALLERAVAINSGTLNPAGVREVGELFRAELAGLGLRVRWEAGTADRAEHLVAERDGPGPRLLLIGHLDTVFEPASPFQRAERTGQGRMKGPGIVDMKGGNVVIVEAIRALAAAGAGDLALTVVLTGDEENPGRPLAQARRALVEAARRADLALGFENADNDPATAVIARRGTTAWSLEVRARPAHSSQIFRPDVGAGAVFEAARLLDGFRARLAGERYLTLNPGLVLGGTGVALDRAGAAGSADGKTNVIAGRVVVRGDLRALTPEQLEAAKATMRELAASPLPHAASSLTFEEGYPPMAPTDGNRRLLAAYDRASRDLGLGPVTPVDPGSAGAADIAFAAAHVDGALDGLGLLGAGDHTVEETADLATLASQTKRAAILIHRLARGHAAP